MVSQRTIARARQTVRKRLTQTCVIRREATEMNKYGNPTHNVEVVESDVPCRVISLGNQSSSQAEGVGSQEVLTESHRLIVSYDTTLGADYSVVTGGRTYTVTKVVDQWAQSVDVQAIVVRTVNDG